MGSMWQRYLPLANHVHRLVAADWALVQKTVVDDMVALIYKRE